MLVGKKVILFRGIGFACLVHLGSDWMGMRTFSDHARLIRVIVNDARSTFERADE